MRQNKIIFFITTLFILSSTYLFFVSDRSLNSDAEKSWWTIYFEDPKNNNLDFTIENHSAKNNFHWEISTDNQKISAGDVEIKTGELKNVKPEIKNITGKISVIASNGDDKKEIYKNL